jgi:hypothetical protein
MYRTIYFQHTPITVVLFYKVIREYAVGALKLMYGLSVRGATRVGTLLSTSEDTAWKVEEMKAEITSGMGSITNRTLATHMENINLFPEIILNTI